MEYYIIIILLLLFFIYYKKIIKNKLYFYLPITFLIVYIILNNKKKIPKIIWGYWNTGISGAPETVVRCFSNWQKQCEDYFGLTMEKIKCLTIKEEVKKQ